MPKFEYRTVVFETLKILVGMKLNHEAFLNKINELGAEGWELVNTFALSRGEGTTCEVIAVFKRQMS